MANQKRAHNFNPGPAILPLPVLEQMQAELLSYQGTGMSVMELSHRSAEFEDILKRAEADLRTLLNVPASYSILFLQGGANLQFAMAPMNLRPSGAAADYVLTGAWSQAAVKEAEKLGRVHIVASTAESNFSYIPAQADLQLDPQAAYVHFTSNETIQGIEWPSEPQPPNGVPLVCDASSDILSRPIDVTKYGLIYAGAQKNLGPAGVALVIIRSDLLERTPPQLPALLDYKLMAKNKSLYNTPPTFGVYTVGLVLHWMIELGGLAEIDRRNAAKAQRLYAVIDASGGFYRGHARPDSRSRMNVTFRLPSEDLEKQFVKKSQAEGFVGLKGHRSVGGLRASLYNALPLESAEALAQFMQEFQRMNG
ncbi:MAG TPA: 3-phosphoserine/phosphohydroxythreonine transaminase [Anaerolineae bacterium]|nr:3-phosphoserine/phosphohydroxythreonine transaminase [Anaerolineae bacterium]